MQSLPLVVVVKLRANIIKKYSVSGFFNNQLGKVFSIHLSVVNSKITFQIFLTNEFEFDTEISNGISQIILWLHYRNFQNSLDLYL